MGEERVNEKRGQEREGGREKIGLEGYGNRFTCQISRLDRTIARGAFLHKLIIETSWAEGSSVFGEISGRFAGLG